MDKDKQKNDSNQFSYFITVLLTVFFTISLKRAFESKFIELQGLSYFEDLLLYSVIFVPCYLLFSKVTHWLYSDRS